VLQKYREVYDQYIRDVQGYCMKKQVTYVMTDINVPFEEVVLRFLRRGGIVG